MSCLFTNIQKEWNLLKISLLFKKKKLQLLEISRALFLYEPEQLVKFSNLHQYTFIKARYFLSANRWKRLVFVLLVVIISPINQCYILFQ